MKHWKWISEPNNQKTLAFIGGGLTALTMALWGVFTYVNPPDGGSDSKAWGQRHGKGMGSGLAITHF